MLPRMTATGCSSPATPPRCASRPASGWRASTSRWRVACTRARRRSEALRRRRRDRRPAWPATERRLERTRSCCRTTANFAERPGLMLSDRVQHLYPRPWSPTSSRAMFRVDNPDPKPGLRRGSPPSASGVGIRRRDLARDSADGLEDVRMRRWPWRPPLTGVEVRATRGRGTAQPSRIDRFTEFRVHPAPTSRSTRPSCSRLQHPGVRRRLPGQPVRAHGRRRDPVQLRAVLRVRHVLPRLQSRRRDHVAYPVGGYGVVFHRS